MTVEAPASSANLGPGYDVFALALDSPRDRIRLTVRPSRELRVKIEQASGSPLPRAPAENGAGAVCLSLAKDKGLRADVTLRIWKRVPIGVGMGSSAASAAAAVVAMNEAFDLGLKSGDLTYYAGKGEEVTSGTAHYDNVAASILGGFVVVRSAGEGGGRRPEPIRLPPPKGMRLCVATPVVKLPARKTEYARSILPRSVELTKVVDNVSRASTIVAGFALRRVDIIGAGMEDVIVEEARKVLIPGYELVRGRAKEAGASGVCISGAGPSVLAVVAEGVEARKVLSEIIRAFRESGVDSEGFVTKVGEGARVVGDE